MAKISPAYINIVEKWLLNGLTLENMHLSPEQQFRTKICYEAYQVWLQDKQIRPNALLRRIAAREYPILLHKAEQGDENAQEIVRRCKIEPGKPRTVTEISNDVAVFNWIIGRFNAPTEHIERAKVEDASDWLIREGMKMGDARAVKSGADLKMSLYKNFDEKEDAAANIPSTDINITGDVSIIKSDRVNYTPEEKKRLARKYGLTVSEVNEMMNQEDPSWQMDAEEVSAEDFEQKDIFEEDDET